MKKIFGAGQRRLGSDTAAGRVPPSLQPASFASISFRDSAIEMSPAIAIPA